MNKPKLTMVIQNDNLFALSQLEKREEMIRKLSNDFDITFEYEKNILLNCPSIGLIVKDSLPNSLTSILRFVNKELTIADIRSRIINKAEVVKLYKILAFISTVISSLVLYTIVYVYSELIANEILRVFIRLLILSTLIITNILLYHNFFKRKNR